MKTAVNGKDAEWTPDVYALFEQKTAHLFTKDQSCSYSNYYTPRPYVDEYNRGSDRFGFTYTVQPGNHVCFVNWRAA